MKQIKFNRKQLWKKCKILLLICGIYYLLTWFTGCPIHFFLGVSCPGCGMTRAWLALLHLDISGAFAAHPLFWLAPLVVLAILFDDQIDFSRHRPLILLIATAFFLVYLARLFWFPGDIVVWQPQEGFLFRTFKKFLL